MKQIFLLLVYGACFLIPSAQSDLERCGSSVSLGTKRIVYYQIVNEGISLNSSPDYASDPIEPILRWYRDGRLIAANKRLITFVAESGLNGSVYRFTVSEFRGDVIFESEDVVLIVGEIPRLELLGGRRLSFREASNDALKIRLDVAGVPRPRLRVVRPQNRSRVVSSAKFEIRSNAIHVRGLSLEDWGDYEVIASNCLGNVMINISIKILGGVDQTNLTDTTKTVFCSKNVEYICSAVAYPKPSIKWFWNETLLFDGRYGITEESVMAPDGHRLKITSTLKIFGVEREDNERGLIRCKSKNDIEETSVGFQLNVLCTPSACGIHFVQLTNDSIVANIDHPSDTGGFSVNYLRVLVYVLFNQQSSLISNNTYGPDQEFIKLKNLSSSSTYQFLCQADNALGYGEVGKFDAQTLGEPQSSVRINVAQSNCTSATLEFHSETVGINSQIRYEVLYTVLAGIQNEYNGSFSMASAIKERSNCPVTTIFNLKGNTKYAAVVRELNVYGAGAFSDPVHFETFCVADADGYQMPVWLIAVVLVGDVTLIFFLYYKYKRLKKEFCEAKNDWQSKKGMRKIKTLIDEHFCNNPPTILLLGQSEHSSLVNIFEFVINLAVNEEAALHGAENCHESEPAKLMMHETLADDCRVNQRGPTFLDSQGLLAKIQTEMVRPIVMMLALGYLPVKKNLDEVYDDFSQAILHAGDGDEPSSRQYLPDNVLNLLCPEEIVEDTLDGDDKQRRLRKMKRVVEGKIQFYKNAPTPAKEAKPHIVLLVWNTKNYKQLLSQLQAIKDALLAARRVKEEERGRMAAGTTESVMLPYPDLELHLLFTSDYVLQTKEKKKLEKEVVYCLPTLEDKVLFVSNCIARQRVKVEHRLELEVIRVLEVVLKPNEEKHLPKIFKIVRKLKSRLSRVFDQDECDGMEDENLFLRALKNLDLAASGVINVRRKFKMSRESSV